MRWRLEIRGALLVVGTGALVVALTVGPWILEPTTIPRGPEPLGSPFLAEPVAVRSTSGDKVDLRAPVDGAAVLVFYPADRPADLDVLARGFSPHRLLVVGVLVGPALEAPPIDRRSGGDGPAIPIVHDRRGGLARRFGVSAVPEAVVIVGDGRLYARGPVAAPGDPDASPGSFSLRRAVESALAGKPAEVARGTSAGRPIPTTTAPVEGVPTFEGDVAPILERSCRACHRPGQSAPFSLLSYPQAAKRAGDLADVAGRRLMPPWKPVAGKSPPLRHDRTLLPSEIATLRAWADAGAPRGPAAGPPPPPPPSSDGWALGPPDLVLEMDEEYAVPATGDDVYRCFVMPTHLPEDRFLTAIEVKPGNPRVVHHTFSYIDVRGLGRSRDRDDPGPGYPCFSGFTGDRVFGALGGWTPGNEAHAFGDGIGLHLPKDADVVVQVHYHPSGKPEVDRTRLGLHFAKKPVRQSLQWISACADPETLELPADDPDIVIRTHLTIPMDVELQAMTPHTHLLGRSFAAEVDLPDGRTIPLIAIDDWDFNRQDTYYLREPLRLPAGSVVRVEGRFDNSSANPRNPNRPPRLVRWGEGTKDDMLILFLAMTEAGQDLTRPGVVDDFMETFFRQAGVPPPP